MEGFDPFDSTVSMDTNLLEVKRYVGAVDLDRVLELLQNRVDPRFLPRARFLELSPAQVTCLREAFGGRQGQNSREELSSLEAQLNRVIFAEFPSGCFVRLTTRSPKDALLSSPSFFAEFAQEMAQIPPGDPNADGQAFYRAVMRAGRCEGGAKAVWLLTNSSRVFHDLSRIEQCRKEGRSGEEFRIQIALLAYRFIEPASEFRIFVYNNRVSAASQYLDTLYFPSLDVPWLQQQLADFQDKIVEPGIGVLPPAYVCDVSLGQEGPYLIEVNPFFHKTGACLFDWRRDRHLLQGVDSNVIVRVQLDPEAAKRDFGCIRKEVEQWKEEAQKRASGTKINGGKQSDNSSCFIQ